MMRRPRGVWVIGLSFVVAFMLTTVPLPSWALPWRPAWVAMVLVYWCIALPERIGILAGWCVGLLLDVLNGSLLGQHAFGLALVAYIAILYHRRVRVFPVFQQSAFVGSIVFVYTLLMLWIYNLLGSVKYGYVYLFAALTTALLWPWMFIILRDVRRKGNVS